MKRVLFTLLLTMCCSAFLSAQMVVGTDTLYGNEWINYDQQYLRINITEDGVYQINRANLEAAGWNMSAIQGEDLQLFYLGEEQPIHVSTDGTLGSNDFIEFVGKQNIGNIDSYLYANDASHTNPYYSLFTDTAAYFLTFNTDAGHTRFTPVNNDLNNPPSAEPYFIDRSITVFSNKHLIGFNVDDLFEARFDVGEGWSSGFARNRNIPITLGPIAANGPSAIITSRITSRTGTHDLSINFNDVNYIQQFFNGYVINDFEFEVPVGLMTTDNIFNVEGAVAGDVHAVSYVQIDYPRTFDFGDASWFEFRLDGSNNQTYLEITNFNHGGTAPVLYDFTNNIQIQTSLSGSTVRVTLPPSSADMELVLVNRNASQSIDQSAFIQKDFVDYFSTTGDFIIITDDRMSTATNGSNPIQDYVDYRNSTGFDAIYVPTEDIYDQFAYGINRNLQGFRNFTHFTLKEWTTTPPRYVLLLGKGRTYKATRQNPDINLPIETVPAFFGSDNLLVSNNTSDKPLIPIGRIAAYNADEVQLYLQKVQTFESEQSNLAQTIEDRAWMKRIIHLGGGDQTIQTVIRNNLNSYKNIIENPFYGGNVFSFFKTSTDPIQISQSEFLDSLINEGSSMITFFGHSSPNSFDFNLDAPQNYENFGRYPLIFSLGCFTGNIYKTDKGLSEEFVLIEDKGAIAFLAATELAQLGALNVWGDRFYRKITTTNYNMGIGDAIQATIEELDNTGFSTRRLNQLMVLHGDPSVKLNTTDAPDYLVKGSDLSFEPSLITTSLDSVAITLTVTNIGRASADSCILTLERTLPDGTLLTPIRERIRAPYFEDTYTFSIPVRNDALGLNQFCIRIDSDEEIDEGPLPFAENNNSFCVNQFILSDDILPIFPTDFAIVPNSEINLKASTTNSFSGEFEYFMEIDTTENFNSPIKRNTTIVQGGGLLEWTPDLTLQDSTVYYWRVQVNPDQVPNSAGWKTQSFTFIENESPGWSQSDHYQFQKNDLSNITYDESREFQYIDDFLELTVDLSYPGVLVNDQIAFYINGSKEYQYGWCQNQGFINFAVFDGTSGQAWRNVTDGNGNGLYNSVECREDVPNFGFQVTTPEGRLAARNFLRDSVPEDAFVLAYSFGDYNPSSWLTDSTSAGEETLFALFEEMGGLTLRTSLINGANPYVGFFQKNNPSFALEQIASNQFEILNTNFLLPGSWDNGYVETPRIGPAEAWSSLHWEWGTLDGQIQNDDVYLQVFGFDENDNPVELANYIQAFDTSMTFIDAETYPEIQLRFVTADVNNRTTPQLINWRVLFEDIAEAAVRPDLFFSINNDTLPQGQELELSLAVENISNVDMDSLLVKYIIADQANNLITIDDRVAPLLANDTITASLKLGTRTLAGNQRLTIEINPGQDQPERFAFNNVAIVDFFVERDALNPLLDVTFDGQHILDGDIVSARPNILISLKDENKFLELGDTSLFKILMQYPNEGALRQVFFDDPTLTFFPADPSNLTNNNRAVIELNPMFDVSGTYQLFVQAKDASGNQSGQLDYKIAFEVITETAISNILNYPNPFTTSTRFVFTLTGSELPDNMMIQIMTVSGKVVREIYMEELGPIRIGNNLTDFAWDGTDMYGDRLANGVYLYRVITQFDGQEVQEFKTNTNQYFKNGYGKMYLMR